MAGKKRLEFSMANFDTYSVKLFQVAGGFVDDPADPGGATNMGISLTVWEQYSQQLLGIAPSLATLQAMTQQQAGVLYKAIYWDYFQGDAINNQLIAQGIVDFGVVFGNGVSAKKVEQVLQLPADGIFGPAVLQALNNANQQQIATQLQDAHKAFAQQLAAQQPVLQKFLQGWLNRINMMAS